MKSRIGEPRWKMWRLAKKHGFASLEELFVFLKQVPIHINSTSGEGGPNQVQGGGESPAPHDPFKG